MNLLRNALLGVAFETASDLVSFHTIPTQNSYLLNKN
jgi:hypothetical protein